MKIKKIMFFVLVFASFQIYASFPLGYAFGVASGNNVNVGKNSSISNTFDYFVTCDLEYKKIKESSYVYFCPNPPKKDKILFMSTVFDFDFGVWPIKIIYYMKNK